MKPIYLKIKAFGPFLEEQYIDFDKVLLNDQLFLISGPTGAGKTTIFDAICYALYGTGSNKDRGTLNTRSDFADETIDTEVEFFFCIKDKKVKIKRNPAYQRAKKRGEGTTDNKANASLIVYDKNNEEITTAYGSTEVTEKVEQLLNINEDQFRQTIMIPQGEFRKFITAKSDQKAEIFKKIFDISIYEEFENRINEKYKTLKTELEKNKEKLRTILEGLNTESGTLESFLEDNQYINTQKALNIIDAEKTELNKNIEEITKNKKILENKELEIKKELDEKIKNNEKIQQKEELKLQLNTLLKSQDEMQTKESNLNKIQKAEKIIPHEDNYVKSKIQIKDKENILEQNENKIKQSQKQLRIDKPKLELVEKDYNKISAIKKDIEELNKKLTKINDLKKLEEALNKETEKLNSETKKLEKLENKKTNNINEIEKNENYIDENSDLQIEMLDNKIKEKEKILKLSKNTIKNIDKLENLNKKYKKISEEKSNIYNLLKEKRKELEIKTKELINSQSFILAKELKQGEPCPVCGSTNHPNSAKTETKIVNQDDIQNISDEIKNIENTFEKVEKQFDEINTEYIKLKDNINQEFKRINQELNISEIDKNNKKEHLKNITRNLDQEIKNQKEKFSENKKIEHNIKIKKENNYNLKKENKELEEKIKKINETIQETNKSTTTLETQQKTLKDELKGETKEKVIEQINKKQTFIKSTEKNYIKLKNNVDKLNDEINSLKGSIENQKKELEYLKKEEEINLKKLNNMLKNNNFDNIEEYREYKKSHEEIQQLEKEIKIYNDQLQKIQNLFEEKQNETKNIEKTDINPIKEKLNNLNFQIEELITNKTTLKNKIDNLEKTIDKITEINTEIEAKEKQYEIIKHINDISKGINNSNISLSKYVLAYYFEKILFQANQSLKKMTDNRYKLFRATQVLDGRRREGLEIMIFDNYTAKEREIQTLSGGESFKTSLSLALGLANVVQSHSGGISLDAIFIDEGFGSLDSNSLDSAIEILSELNKTGRIVGIISHVSELKERINSKIEVVPYKSGSIIKN
jgi:exonuclease SbcC